MTISFAGSSGMNFNTLNDTIYSSLRSQENKLVNSVSNISKDADGNISQTDLLKLQQETQQWTIMIDLQSTITKQISDSLKGVIQKSS